MLKHTQRQVNEVCFSTSVLLPCLSPQFACYFLSSLDHFRGRFTRYDFLACDKLTTGLRHELLLVNQTHNSLTTVVCRSKKCRRVLKHVLKRCDIRSRNR